MGGGPMLLNPLLRAVSVAPNLMRQQNMEGGKGSPGCGKHDDPLQQMDPGGLTLHHTLLPLTPHPPWDLLLKRIILDRTNVIQGWLMGGINGVAYWCLMVNFLYIPDLCSMLQGVDSPSMAEIFPFFWNIYLIQSSLHHDGHGQWENGGGRQPQ